MQDVHNKKQEKHVKETISLLANNQKSNETFDIDKISKSSLKVISKLTKDQLCEKKIKEITAGLFLGQDGGIKVNHSVPFSTPKKMIDHWYVDKIGRVIVTQYFCNAAVAFEHCSSFWNKKNQTTRLPTQETCFLKSIRCLEITSSVILPEPGFYKVEIQIHKKDGFQLSFLNVSCSGSESIGGFQGRLWLKKKENEKETITLGLTTARKECSHAILRLWNTEEEEKKNIEFDFIKYTKIYTKRMPQANSHKSDLEDYKIFKSKKDLERK